MPLAPTMKTAPRRRLLALARSLAAALGLALACACTRASEAKGPAQVRVGHFPNVTHAQGVIAHGLSRQGRGWFEERLGAGVEVQWFVYNAGPSAMEALLAGSVDLVYVGPNPAVNAHLASRGSDVRILAGACSGGAALVVQADGRIQRDEDFRGRRVGTPQLGNTQDVAARAWLESKGLRVTQTGGDALVLPAANADLLAMFQRGDLDAAWTVEPWVSRLVLEAGARVYLDERELWPETGGRYVTTHLASSVRFLEEHPDLVRRFLDAHVELTRWIQDHPEEAQRELNLEMKAETTMALAPEVLERAWSRLELTHDPIQVSLLESAADAHRIGFLRAEPDLGGIYALDLLGEVLEARGLAPLSTP